MRYREMRIPCDTEVAVTAGEAARRARFINISPSGARVQGLDGLPVGALVTLHHLGRGWPACVAWCRSGQAGLRFPMPLGDEEIGFLRGTGARSGTWGSLTAARFRELT